MILENWPCLKSFVKYLFKLCELGYLMYMDGFLYRYAFFNLY